MVKVLSMRLASASVVDSFHRRFTAKKRGVADSGALRSVRGARVAAPRGIEGLFLALFRRKSCVLLAKKHENHEKALRFIDFSLVFMILRRKSCVLLVINHEKS